MFLCSRRQGEQGGLLARNTHTYCWCFICQPQLDTCVASDLHHILVKRLFMQDNKNIIPLGTIRRLVLKKFTCDKLGFGQIPISPSVSSLTKERQKVPSEIISCWASTYFFYQKMLRAGICVHTRQEERRRNWPFLCFASLCILLRAATVVRNG